MCRGAYGRHGGCWRSGLVGMVLGLALGAVAPAESAYRPLLNTVVNPAPAPIRLGLSPSLADLSEPVPGLASVDRDPLAAILGHPPVPALSGATTDPADPLTTPGLGGVSTADPRRDPDAATLPEHSRARIQEGYGQLPMHFEPNLGQSAPEVRYLARGAGYSLFLTEQEAVLVLRQGRPDDETAENDRPAGASRIASAILGGPVSTRPFSPLPERIPPRPFPSPKGQVQDQGDRAGPVQLHHLPYSPIRHAASHHPRWSSAQLRDRLTSREPPEPAKAAVVRMRLDGPARNPTPKVAGQMLQAGISNYYRGNDPAKWQSGVPHYAQVQYDQVYPGIDLVFRGNPHQLEYDLVLAPGADPQQIRLSFEGVDGMRIDHEGNLILTVAGGEIVQKAPRIYQRVDGQERPVAGRYMISDEHRTVATGLHEPRDLKQTVGFQLADYDRKHALTLDPVLIYSTFLGGGDGYTPRYGELQEFGSAIAVDRAGNAYITGGTYSPNFPAINSIYPNLGGCDAFVTKLDANGQGPVYSTYLGGTDSDSGASIAVDDSGNAYISGFTQSSDFPIVNAFFPRSFGISVREQDVFVTKLNALGQGPVYSTYLGVGSDPESGYSEGNAIAVDRAGNAYIAGRISQDFLYYYPIKTNVYHGYGGYIGQADAFLTKLDAMGQGPLYFNFLGGSDNDSASGVAVDGDGNAYVTGWSWSCDFPVVNARYPRQRYCYQPDCGDDCSDAFVAKFDAFGQGPIYSTYLGGREFDDAFGIGVDDLGNAYVIGWNGGGDFPLVNAIYSDCYTYSGFVTAFDAMGQGPIYSTCLPFVPGGIAVDGVGNAYIGSNWENDEGHNEAGVTKLNAQGQGPLYSVRLRGESANVYANGIAIDGTGNAYLTGATESSDFPTVNAVYPHLEGDADAFVAKIATADNETPVLRVTVNGSGTVTSDPAGIDCGSDCSESFGMGTPVTLTATAEPGWTLSGWGGACIAAVTDSCTLTADSAKTAVAVFQTTTPEQVAPDRPTIQPACPAGGCVTTSTNAVLITHGWNSNAFDWVEEMAQGWVEEMAQGVCRTLNATQYFPERKADAVLPICSGNGWDVFTVDWSTMAFDESILPPITYVKAENVGHQVSTYLRRYNYRYIHLIGHSAGSNVIETAASVLAPFSVIHETFLDAYDPQSNMVADRHVSDHYGSSADYADNYVDTRTLGAGVLDPTDLHLTHAYNIDVTPEGDDDCGVSGIACRHSRPYRFYLKSIFKVEQGNDDYDASYQGAGKDRVAKTGEMGFVFSKEAEDRLNILAQRKDTACHMDDAGNCPPVANPTHGALYYLRGAIRDTTVDAVTGAVNYTKGAGAKLFDTLSFSVSTPSLNGMAVARDETMTKASQSTPIPAWMVTYVTTTSPVNRLRFNWRFASGGEGFMQVFVNENLVGQLDQRFLPVASAEPKSLYVGELPPGTYRIAFRLDGYGTAASGIELTGVELGLEGLATGPSQALSVTTTGSGRVASDLPGIDCGTSCRASFPGGVGVTLRASADTGAVFAGWGGDCTGSGACTLSMSRAKSVTARFNPKTYWISASANPASGGTLTCTPNPVTHGGSATCTASPKTGYDFSNFSGACTGSVCKLSNVTGDKGVTANFSLKTYRITGTATPVAGGAVICTPNPVPHGAGAVCTASANPGWTFAGFSGACTGPNCVLSNVTAAKSVTAKFTVKTYPISTTASPDAGGTLRCTPNPVTHGGSGVCTASPKTGYYFTRFGGACSGPVCNLANVTGTRSVTAYFSLKSYQISGTPSPAAGGTVNCAPNPVPHGNNATCTASPNPGWTFAGFSGACSGSTCSLNKVTANKSVTAKFVPKSYSVTTLVSPAVGGSLRCTPNPVTHGGSSTCTATPKAGYLFGGFGDACSGSSCVLSGITGAKTVTATFVRKTP